MELEIIFKALFALGIVLGSMYIVLRIVQRYTKFGTGAKSIGKTGGLKIENIVYIDETMKIVNITDRIGNTYIIAVGKNNSFLIDKYNTKKQEENE